MNLQQAILDVAVSAFVEQDDAQIALQKVAWILSKSPPGISADDLAAAVVERYGEPFDGFREAVRAAAGILLKQTTETEN